MWRERVISVGRGLCLWLFKIKFVGVRKESVGVGERLFLIFSIENKTVKTSSSFDVSFSCQYLPLNFLNSCSRNRQSQDMANDLAVVKHGFVIDSHKYFLIQQVMFSQARSRSRFSTASCETSQYGSP